MKRLRIILAALLFIVCGSAFAFADVVIIPKYGPAAWIVYCIPVIVILIALALLRRAVKKRRLQNNNTDPEEQNDITIR